MSDPDSRILPSKEGGYAPNYTPMAVTETENGFIVGVDLLIGNVEHTVIMGMIESVEEAYQVEVSTVMADGAYATGPNFSAAEERGLGILSPMRQEVAQVDNPAFHEDLTKPVVDAELDRLPINSTTKRFDKLAFVDDAQNDCYFCPAGKKLKREGTKKNHYVRRRNGTKELSLPRMYGLCIGFSMSYERRFQDRSESGTRRTPRGARKTYRADAGRVGQGAIQASSALW